MRCGPADPAAVGSRSECCALGGGVARQRDDGRDVAAIGEGVGTDEGGGVGAAPDADPLDPLGLALAEVLKERVSRSGCRDA